MLRLPSRLQREAAVRVCDSWEMLDEDLPSPPRSSAARVPLPRPSCAKPFERPPGLPGSLDKQGELKRLLTATRCGHDYHLAVPFAASPAVLILDKDLSLPGQMANAQAWSQARMRTTSAAQEAWTYNPMQVDLRAAMESWAPMPTARMVVCLLTDWFGLENCCDGAGWLDWHEGLSCCGTMVEGYCLPADECALIHFGVDVWYRICREQKQLPVKLPEINQDCIFAWQYRQPVANKGVLFYIITPYVSKQRRVTIASHAMAKLMSMRQQDVLNSRLDPLKIYNRIKIWSPTGEQVKHAKDWHSQFATLHLNNLFDEPSQLQRVTPSSLDNYLQSYAQLQCQLAFLDRQMDHLRLHAHALKDALQDHKDKIDRPPREKDADDWIDSTRDELRTVSKKLVEVAAQEKTLRARADTMHGRQQEQLVAGKLELERQRHEVEAALEQLATRANQGRISRTNIPGPGKGACEGAGDFGAAHTRARDVAR